MATATATQTWTQGESLPIEDMVIGNDAVMETDAQEVADNNVSGPLPPGNYVLKIVGFGAKPKTELKTVYVNGQAANYQATQISVMLVDDKNSGMMFQNLILPPSDARQMAAYAHGKKSADAKGAGGFFSNVFVNFVGSVFPGAIVKGEPMKPIARNLKNWIGKRVWAQVEMDKGGYVKDGIDDATGLPYAPTEPRPQIKLFSFREYVEGGPCPYATDPATATKYQAAPKAKGNAAPAPAPAEEDNGVDDI